MTETDVRKLLFTINSAYPTFRVENPDQMVAVWMEFLGDQDPIAIGAALKQRIRTSTSNYAPSIGELIQGAYEIRNKENELTPGEAWSLVYKALCRSTYYAEEEYNKLPPLVQKAVGSPYQLRAWASDSSFNEGVAASNFRKAYATVCERSKSDALMSPDVRRYIESLGVKAIEGGG